MSTSELRLPEIAALHGAFAAHNLLKRPVVERERETAERRSDPMELTDAFARRDQQGDAIVLVLVLVPHRAAWATAFEEEPTLDPLDRHSVGLVALGYAALGEFGIPGRRYFRKNAPDGTRTHQLHAFAAGSSQIERRLDFRDYLRAFPVDAAAYAARKQELADVCAKLLLSAPRRNAAIARCAADSSNPR